MGRFCSFEAAVFLASVDATIAVAAFPALRLSLAEASPSDLSWVLNVSTNLYAALLVPSGRLVDLHGSRRLFLIGVAVFTLASAACGMAPGTGSLIAARVVQAVGGAILTPASLALILGAFPLEKRTAIVGMWSGVGALGVAVGPWPQLGDAICSTLRLKGVLWITGSIAPREVFAQAVPIPNAKVRATREECLR